MAIDIPNNMEINPFGCKWDPEDPRLCFDADACGCYLDPCDYFDMEDQDCPQEANNMCCTIIETC